jgi:hypothetical protein
MQMHRTAGTGHFTAHSGTEAAVMQPMFLSGAKNSGGCEDSFAHI